MEKRGFRPLVAFPGSNKPWKSKCTKCSKTTSPTYWNVAKGTGCKYCSGRAVEPLDAVKAMKKRGMETLEPFPGATGWLSALTARENYLGKLASHAQLDKTLSGHMRLLRWQA